MNVLIGCYRSFFTIPAGAMPNKKKSFNRSKPTDQPDIRPSQKRRMRWSNEQMERAMKAVFDEGVSVNKAAILHRVPSTLQGRLSGRVIHGRKPGPQPYLDAEQCSKTLKDVLVVERKDAVPLQNSAVIHAKVFKRNLTLSLRVGDITARIGLDAINADNLKNYLDKYLMIMILITVLKQFITWMKLVCHYSLDKKKRAKKENRES